MNQSIERFITAQNNVEWGPQSNYERALSEMKSSRKENHWIWYIFPKGPFGYSETSKYYSIRSTDEAKAFLSDPTLGTRLREITAEVLKHSNKKVEDIFDRDFNKFRASMTLFSLIDEAENSIFQEAIDVFFKEEKHYKTIAYFHKKG